ncbi:MAG: ATP synthase F1 subunit delta [Pseudomonadota bacterium]|nr:ATP synthase F1 subunit delta [Pseudomonadota bacterium]
MSELLTQSRPYAEAIFEIAKEENTLDLWVADLSVVAVSMQEAEVKRLIDSPDISQKLKAETFTKLFEGEISNKVLNFVLVLGQANRLKLLKSVLDNFKNLVALEKNEKNVVISSSYALDSDNVYNIK